MTPRILCYVIIAGMVSGMVCPPYVVAAPPVQLAQGSGAGEVERLFEYYAGLRSLSGEALQRERSEQEQAFAQNRSHFDRLRLVCVLSVLNATGGEIARAVALLHDYFQDQEPQPTSLQALATLLWQVLHSEEQLRAYAEFNKKLQDSLSQHEKHLAMQQQTQQKLQDELASQRALTHAAQRQLQEAVSAKERHSALQRQLTKKLQDEKKNVRKLQEKIDKIQDIEKSLLEREQPDNKGT